MTRHENDLFASLAQRIQAPANQVSSNAFALMFEQHRDRRKGENHGGFVPQVFDEIGFVDPSRSGFVGSAKGGLVVGMFTMHD